MAVRPILVLDDPRLRTKAKKVKRIDGSIQRIIDDMIDTMRDAPGAGLAATQIGVPLRIIVARAPKDEDDPLSGRLIVLCNPEILRWEGEEEAEEGCLSVPGYVGDVKRAARVLVQGKNRADKVVRFEAQGWLARIFQHEIDHLNGMVYVDRLASPSELRKLPPEEESGEADGL